MVVLVPISQLRVSEMALGDLGETLAVRLLVSCVLVLASQFGLAAIPRFKVTSSVVVHVAISGFVLVPVFGLGRWFKRLLGLKASAPALVIFNLVFAWGVYLAVIRRVGSALMDFVLNLELLMLIFGMWRIMSSDPGLVTHDFASLRNKASGPYASIKVQDGNSEDQSLSKRIRQCNSCKAYVKGYDHHCPAFGNCIGQKNYLQFMVLLIGFITTEVTYAICCHQFITTTKIMDNIGEEIGLSGSLAISTMTFCFFQVTWQVFFLAWHIYCICYNITTDEWTNWAKYPEFHHDTQQLLDEVPVRFRNPYHKGVLHNLKEFCVHTP